MLAMVALFPTRQIGVEFGSIMLIFTGQVWNMAFSFYARAEHSAGTAGGFAHYRFALATFFTTGTALYGDRAGVELDGFGCGRLVLPDGVRDVRSGKARFSASGFGIVSAIGGERGRHGGDYWGWRR